MKGIDLFKICPNKNCEGIFLRDQVKEILKDNEFNKLLKNVLEQRTNADDMVDSIVDTEVEIKNFENLSKADQAKQAGQMYSFTKDNKFKSENFKIDGLNISEPQSIFNFKEQNSKSNELEHENNRSQFIEAVKIPLIFTSDIIHETDLKNKNNIFNRKDESSRNSFVLKNYNLNENLRSNESSNNISFLSENNLSSKCPICTEEIKNIDNSSNYVRCHSIMCAKKNTYFCRICMEIVPLDKKRSHFPKGNYKNECRNIDSKLNF
jgi:hypothetical protein